MIKIRMTYHLFLLFSIAGITLPVTAEPPIAPETIILISIDTLRADRMSCYGYEHETTPNIDALAKESLFFENPFSPVPMTLPSHSSMFTGLTPPSHGVHLNTEFGLPEAALTLPEILQEEGYTTYGTVSTMVIDRTRGTHQGFDIYDDATFNGSKDVPLRSTSDGIRVGNETTKRALQWLNDNADKKKFMFIHYFDPHIIYQAPPPFDTRFKDPYDAEIAFTDYCVGQILDRLKALNLYDDALIALVGDHGEMLGEHGEDTHSYFIYNNVLRVPMMYKLPGAVQSKRVKEATSLIDVAPTLLSLADLEVPEVMEGVDLSNYLRSDFSLPDRAIYSESMTPTAFNASSLYALFMGQWHYIQSKRPELYNWLNDPEETNNLIAQHPEQASKMKEHLKGILAKAESLEADTDTGLDAEALEQLQSLGYVGGNTVADYSFEQGEEDAKDLIEVHNGVFKALNLAKAGDVDSSIKIFTDIIERYPKASQSYNQLLRLFMQLGELDKALDVLEQMRTVFPDDSLVLRYRADIHMKRKDYPSTLIALNEYIALKEDDAMAYEMLVQVYMNQKAFDKVKETLGKWRAAFLGDPQMLIQVGKIYEEINDRSNAMTSYLNALALNPQSNPSRIQVGNLYYRMKNYEQALLYFDQALAQDPNLPSVHGRTALIKADRSNPRTFDPPTALNHAKMAYELSVDQRTGQCNSPMIFDTLAFVLAVNGQLDQAIYAGTKALELYNAQKLTAQAQRMKQQLNRYQQQKMRFSQPR